MAKTWFVMLVLASLLSLIGTSFANVFGINWPGKLLCITAIWLLTIASAIFGSVVMLEALTGRVEKIPDGKDDITVTLRIGPFSYKKAIPPDNTEK